MTSANLTPGSLFAERFEILRAAGHGGMGTVYRALDRASGRPVGLKLLHQARLGRDDAERFTREAQLLAELRHPGIVSYIAHGEVPSGPRYLAMEWLEGEDLGRRLTRGPLSVPDSLTLLSGLAASLAVAHSHGIIHRDIKPSNILLVNGELRHAKLIDFGVARRVNRVLPMTDPGLVVGTPEYMAPEQARGAANLTCAADVFALGCVLYECLSGRPPFSADHIAAVLCRILLEEPAPLTRICPAVPTELGRLAECMLAKDPAARLPDAAAVGAALAALESQPRGGAALADTLLVRALPSLPSRHPEQVLAAEQVLMSLVLARSRPPAVDRLGPTMEPAVDAERSTLEGVLSQVGARAHFLVEGTLVVTLPTRGSAQDQATLAARTALLLRDRLPDTRMIVLTGRGTRERTQVVGNLVELGMRLLTSEPVETGPAGILLDPLSSQLLSPRFRTERVAERTYLHSEDVDADETRLLLGRPTPCVGREVELTSLDTVLETCIEERERQIVLISGAAGQGKSRLRHEFLRRLSQSGRECTVLSLRGEPTAAPYSVLRHALRRHSHIAESAPREVQLAQLRAHLPCGSTSPPRLLDFLAELLGVPGAPLDPLARRAAEQDPRLMRDQLRWAFAELLRETCQRLPLLLVIDDLQWCDAATLDLIDHAALALQDAPLFILALGRSEPAAAQHDLFRAHRPRSLQLGRLGRRSCERLVRQVLSSVNPALLSDARIARLVDQSAGNALLLEELIRASVESPEDDRPQTVLAMLQARLGALETAERHALLLASVLGNQFSARDLVALQGDELRASLVQTHLQALKEAELIEVQTERSASADLAEFVFRNELIREAAYELISADERAALHRRVAQHLESAHPSAALRIGSHWLSAEEREPAITWLCRAAEQALDGHDLQETLRIAEVAIAAGAAGEALGRLRALQAAAAFWQGGYQQCQRWALAALPVIRRGSGLFFRVLADAFIASSRIGDQAMVESLQREALSMDADAGASDEGLICLARMSFHFLISLDFRRADLLLGRLKERMPAQGSQAPLVRAQIAHAIGMRAAVLGDMAGYAEKIVEVLAAFDEAGDMRNACIETTTLAISLLQLGQSAEAERLCRENLARCEQLRANQATHYTKLTLGLILTRRERELAEARQLLADMIKEYESIGHQRRVGLGHGYLALLLLCEGNLSQAEQAAERAASHLAEAGGFGFWALALQADILLRAGRPAEALPLAQKAADGLAQSGGAPLMELLPFVVLGETLCALAQREAAQRVVTLACQRLAARIAQITNPVWRAGYLALPEQRRLRHLAQALCPDQLPGELLDPTFLHDTPSP